MGKLDRLEAIQNAINHGVIRLQIYKDNYKMAFEVGSDWLMKKYRHHIDDLKRGLDRLRIAFNNELENLKYRG